MGSSMNVHVNMKRLWYVLYIVFDSVAATKVQPTIEHLDQQIKYVV